MTHRRRLLQLALLALPSLGATAAAAPAAGGGIRDFDFFLGSWDVQHRRLRKRLVGADDWEEFKGTTRCQSLLGGVVNLNESRAVRETGPTNGMGLRAYDAKSGLWADWYLSAANAHNLENPGIGRFGGKVGDFFSDETFEGRPIKVRGRFTSLRRSRPVGAVFLAGRGPHLGDELGHALLAHFAPMMVRRASVADLPALIPLFDRYRQFYGQPSDEARARAFLAERLDRGESVVFLAGDGSGAIGFTQIYPSFSSIRTRRLMILNDLYVDPARRRSGAGQALIEAATAYARGEGAAGLVLSTGAGNAPAQALYERLGWVRDTGFYEYGFNLA